MNFTAIDFETANGKRNSACAMGLVRVENGQITEEKSWLIQPPELYFHPINIQIHGITAENVMGEPSFEDIWSELHPYFEDQLVIAHNASFDMSVLRACLQTYDIGFPRMEYLCTVQLSKQIWPQMINHKLNTMADYFGIPLQHHDAMDDTRACAKIALKACSEYQSLNLEELASQLKIKPGRIYPSGYCAPKRFK
ncbi:MAG: 3'-5' exonuclease [Marinifilaceae bacterium]